MDNINRNFHKKLLVILFAALTCFFTSSSSGLASSMGPSGGLTISGKYGGDDFLLAYGPPPGFYLLNYSFYYAAHKFKDYGGREINQGPFRGFKLRLSGNTIRPIWVSEIKIWGAYWGMDMGIPLIEKKVECSGFTDRASGLGDMVLCPLWLAWHGNIFHFLLSFDMISPTGVYDKNDRVNIGNNHWTFEPMLGITAIFPNRFTVDLNLLYDFNWKNNDYMDPLTQKETYHKSGQAFHLDYAIGYRITGHFRLGIAGYYWKDVTKDKIDGRTISDSKGQVFSMGPVINFQRDQVTISLKTQWETMVKNRPQGTMTWLRVLYAF